MYIINKIIFIILELTIFVRNDAVGEFIIHVFDEV